RDHAVQVHRAGAGGLGGGHAGVERAEIGRLRAGWIVGRIRAIPPPIMPLLVKICGLKTPDALDAALDAGADMVGFVFFPPSPRHLGYEAARLLGERVKGRAVKVALSVDATELELANLIEALKPDMLQLHGKETPERVALLRTRFGLPVMKALPVAEESDLSAIRAHD